MSEKKKKIILFCYFIFVGVVCLFAILNHELAEFKANSTISRLENTINSLEVKIDGISVLVSTDQKGTEENIEKEESTSPENKYVIKEYKGIIAIFTSDGKLLRELNVYVKTLPEKDRAMLSYGIEVKDDAKLYSLIQDYTS